MNLKKASHWSNNFTLLRHVAALFVIISHSYDLLGRSGEEKLSMLTNGTLSFSRIGLIVFFFLSGLLVTQSLMTSESLIHFIWKRILRIYPALIILILITVFIGGPVFTTMPLINYFSSFQTWQYFIGGVSLIRLKFFLPAVFNEHGVNGSLWSLPVEFRLYVLLALLYLAAFYKRNHLLILIAIVIVFAFGFSTGLFFSLPKWFNVYTFWGLYFFAGSLVYFVKHKISLSYWFFIFFFLFWIFTKEIEVLGRISQLLMICYGCLLVGYKLPNFNVSFFSKNDYSYSLYIYAFPIQQSIIYIYGVQHISPILLTILSLVLLAPFCLLSWNLVEKPFLGLKDIFIKK
ncbi:MAG: acyltransferase [Chitinophagaceae bacterium]|nr:acyltransferase [Chitinophagaceae bacterium]